MNRYLIKEVVLDESNQYYDLVITEGVFTSVELSKPQDESGYSRVFEGNGRVAIPGFVESHIHLDKALIADRLPNRSGTLREALEVTAQLKATFTREDVEQRAEQALQMLIKNGTTHVRTHAEFDPIGGFHGFEVIMALKEKYKDFIDIQVVAFPQEGIVKAPGTEELMRQAMEMGADVVGGIPYNDTDFHQHLDIVFALAKEFDKPIDLHQDFADTCDKQTIEMVAKRVIAEGYQGKVSVGHLTSLGDMVPSELQATIRLIQQAGINVMSLPMTDLHLGGRSDKRNVRRALTPIRQLRDGGVNVVLATNNIRNPFTPYGNGDLLQVAMLAIPVAHLGGADDLPSVLPMITTKAAKACGFDNYGIEVGKPGTLVLLETQRYQDLIIDLPRRRLIMKNGQVILEDKCKTESTLPRLN
ncbi:amidohydrolase family protein [Aerococcaceae bacterium NML190938]|nr:amidohydrolase family protein [Aerococcaceae bacterium NML190938]